MVHVSKQADYAVILMAYLGRQPQDRRLSAKAIAQDVHVSLPTVTKLLKLLTRAGLLSSTQGVRGGYHLARSVDQISIYQVVEAIDGHVALTACASEQPGLCKTENHCDVKHHWVLINRAIRDTLENLPISMLNQQPMMPRTSLPLVTETVATQPPSKKEVNHV